MSIKSEEMGEVVMVVESPKAESKGDRNKIKLR